MGEGRAARPQELKSPDLGRGKKATITYTQNLRANSKGRSLWVKAQRRLHLDLADRPEILGVSYWWLFCPFLNPEI